MSPSPQLAPPGSSVYSSPTMYVGDGTWDSQRNTFLLPNLQGLNLATMQYNGMGNRFREVTEYFTLIRAHGIIAAITFLFIVPTAILTLRFYNRNPYTALRTHIWLQILTVLLTTVIVILGFMAVGPERALTNPHHGIGLAIYVLVLVQFLGGWWVHSREKKKRYPFIPVKAVLHQWFGRTIALLGIIQIPLGLTLYGSPLWLFIIYTLVAFALLVTYFILSYRRESRRGDSNYSYSSGTGSVAEEHRQTGRLGRLAEGAAAGTGLAALASRFRNRTERRDDPEVIGSRRHSGSYVEEEKYSQYSHDSGRQGGLRDKVLAIGGIATAAYWITRMLGRKNEDHESEGTVSTEEDSIARMERVEEGRQSRPAPSGPHPLSQPPMTPLQHRRSQDSVTEDSYVGNENTGRRSHGLRDAVLGIGAIGLARNIFKKRREKKEDRRIQALREQEIEDERIARANSQRYTGDGVPPRRSGRRSNGTDSILDAAEEGRYTQGLPPPPPLPPPGGTTPAVAGAAGAAVAGAMLADHSRQGSAPLSSHPVASGLPPPPPADPMPPLVPPGPLGAQQYNSSGSEMYTSVNGRTHRRHREYDPVIAGAAGAAAGLVAGEALANRRDRTRDRHSASAGEESTGSGQPVSVKVKMHSDGRHVTLRRLPEEEAAAERAARRSSRDRNGQRRRGDSVSTLDGPDNGVGGGYYRRTEAMERQQANTSREQANLQAAQAQINQSRLAVPGLPPASGSYPPPPPIPSSSSPLGPPGSVSSPGAYDGTGTEASADYAINRKRRRAERAQAKAARADREGQAAVEFT